MFSPLKRTETVPEQIAGILQHAILSEELEAGKKIPSEKELAAQFETNRVSLRQALQILKANKLIEGGQGKAWRVADFRQNAEVNWLPALFKVQGFTSETVQIITDYLNIRTPILTQVLSVAMKRMTHEQQLELREALENIQKSIAEKRPTEDIILADLTWFETLLESSNSLLYQSVYRPFSAIYRQFASSVAMFWEMPKEYPQGLIEVQNAIEAKKAKKAKKRLHVYLEEDAERLQIVLDQASQMLTEKEKE